MLCFTPNVQLFNQLKLIKSNLKRAIGKRSSLRRRYHSTFLLLAVPSSEHKYCPGMPFGCYKRIFCPTVTLIYGILWPTLRVTWTI